VHIKRFLLSIGLLISVIVTPIPSANALSIKVAPAGWTYLFASDTPAKQTATPRVFSVNLEKKSNFVPIYNNVPDVAKAAIQRAIDTWSENFVSKVPVSVNVTWTKASNSTVLASASAKNVFANFNGAPDKTLYYPSALANALAGIDLDTAEPELEINVVTGDFWYYGLDGKCPANKYDLVSVILHEMAHGLGFMSGSYYDPTTKIGRFLQPTAFDAYIQLPDGRRLVDMPSPSLELGSAITSTLFWSGANAVKVNNGVKPLLFTPVIYEQGSSVSHLDEKTFSNTGLPGSVQNVRAVIGDKSAIIKFDPPADFRFAQIDSYVVENLQTGESIKVSESPVVISNLKNGTKYTFSVTSVNSAGSSEATKSNQITPQPAWKSTVIDPNADAKYIATTTYLGKPVVAYSESKGGDLKLATYSNSKWVIKTIDGNDDNAGKTLNNVAGHISLCTSTIGKISYLHVFYADLTNKDLKYALYNGKNFKYETVDGDGLVAQDYKEVNRVRGASDVSVSNACSVNNNVIQVFYRDESQGILLGAVKENGKWRYEIVDGDKDTEDRTTGDVAFHMKSVTVGKKISLIYDSVKGFDAEKNITKGEVRYATRSTSASSDWEYKTLDAPSERTYAVGYDVTILNTAKGLITGWFTSSGFTYPNPDQVKYQDIDAASVVNVKADEFGTLHSSISANEKMVLFSCELRLCAVNKSNKVVNLVSKNNIQKSAQVNWITVGKTKYAIAGISGKLTLFKP